MARSDLGGNGWATRPTRRHRRVVPPATLLGYLGIIAIAIAIICFAAAIQLPFRLAFEFLASRVGRLQALVLSLAVILLGGAVWHRWREAGRRAVIVWGARTGWSPVVDGTVWPWTPRQLTADAVIVEFAIHGTVRGFPVTVGEVAWTRAGLERSVDQSEGRGIFSVLELPRRYPAAAVERRRTIAGRGDDEFTRQYRVVLEDLQMADQIGNPTLQEAHVARRIPPWRITDTHLYAVVPSGRPLTARRVVAAAEQVVTIAELLRIRPARDGA